jgi:hypothetical protein
MAKARMTFSTRKRGRKAPPVPKLLNNELVTANPVNKEVSILFFPLNVRRFNLFLSPLLTYILLTHFLSGPQASHLYRASSSRRVQVLY